MQHRHASSDKRIKEISPLDDRKDAMIVKHISEVALNDPDPSYVAEWQFFLASKGRSLADTDLIRTYTFAVDFMEKWRNARITTRVRLDSP